MTIRPSLILIPFLFVLTACDKPIVNPDIARVGAHENWRCSFHQDIAWELDHNVSADTLILALEACKHPKYRHGDILRERKNKNCRFQVYSAEVLYPDRSVDGKIEPLYRGKEDCNGLVDPLMIITESDLRLK
jgi:hypothetical protein